MPFGCMTGAAEAIMPMAATMIAVIFILVIYRISIAKDLWQDFLTAESMLCELSAGVEGVIAKETFDLRVRRSLSRKDVGC